MNTVPTFPFSSDARKTHEAPVVSLLTAPAEPDINALLLKLTASQRKELLAEVFREDLKTLVAAETTKGYQAGAAKLEEEFAAKQQQWQVAAEQSASAVKTQLQSLLNGLQQLPLTVQCEQQPLMLEWCVSAVSQVLRRELTDRSYLADCLQELMEQSIARDGVVLCCAKADAVILQELLQDQQQAIAVQTEPSLSAGELKLVHGGTYHLSSVAERLELLITEIRTLHGASS